MQAVTVKDALVDPHQTILPYRDNLVKQNPGYFELNKRSQITHDMTTKVIRDCQGKQIVRLDPDHGLRNGGVICQTTFGRKQNETNP